MDHGIKYKQVPPELVNGEIIYASVHGDILYNGRLVNGKRETKDSFGYYYLTITINRRSYFFHELVFYAHTSMTSDMVKKGKVGFANMCRVKMMTNIYRNWFCDLCFKYNSTYNVINAIQCSPRPGYQF